MNLSNCNIRQYCKSGRQNFFYSVISLLRCIIDLRSLDADHVHICANPGIVSFCYSLLSKFLPPFSFSMNALKYFQNNNFWHKAIFLPFSVLQAKSIDCLGPKYKQILMSHTSFLSLEKAFVAPCSFTGTKKKVITGARDIDVTFASRFVEGKGLKLLEASLSKVDDLNIHVCGFGNLNVNLPHAQIYYTSSVIEVLHKSKIFLSLQEVDNYPSQAVLEAISAGCAIIATDVGDTRLFLNDTNAILIPEEPSALISAVRFLLKNEKRRIELTIKAQETVNEYHTVERYAAYFNKDIIGLGEITK